MFSTILIVVVALFLCWIAFKVVSFVASGCLKLVVFGILAAVIAGMIWFQMKGH